ncbi:MAG TPA: TonB-dependent receptor, partial [Holophaga sp.]|nr:TonB-dependent receptor [Holophaga sp.]
MFRRGWACPTLTLLLAAAPAMRAQTPATEGSAQQDENSKFKLGEVTVAVTDTQDPIETAHTRIEVDQIQEMNKDTVSSALEFLPGISTTIGTRNEEMIYVRGFDSRQVPLFIDGVPSYVPYDGEMDYNRFSTYDLSGIQVAKGFSSVTYGANTLGGAINLVTRRPTKPIEGDIRLGIFDGEGRKAAVNFGSNLGKWWIQVGASDTSANWWPMSSSFKANTLEDGGHRTNSDFTDKRYALKIGFTPNDTDEYVIGATRQQGEKGQPPTTDTTVTPKYWRWPTWDKDSIFLTTNTAIGDSSYIKFNTYFDTYENTLCNYTDDSYSDLYINPKSWPTGKSLYKDFAHGAKVEVGTLLLHGQNLKAVIDQKTDVHREGDGSIASTASWKNYEDQYLNWGIEDTISLPRNVDLALGIGQDHMKPVHSYTAELSNPKTFFHAQVGLFWRVVPSTQLYLTFAQKDHFPTLKDRYSLKFSTYYANPDLKPERSDNWEMGIKSKPAEWVELNAAVFRSDIRDLIQAVDTGVPLDPSTPSKGNYMQMQNIGKVQHAGAEVSAEFIPCPTLRTGLGYTYLDRQNKSSDTRLTGTPRQRATGWVRWAPVEKFYAIASIQAQDGLWDSDTVKLGGFATVDLTLGWKPTPQLTLDGGFTNLFDRNYELSDGFPLPGRT